MNIGYIFDNCSNYARLQMKKKSILNSSFMVLEKTVNITNFTALSY